MEHLYDDVLKCIFSSLSQLLEVVHLDDRTGNPITRDRIRFRAASTPGPLSLSLVCKRFYHVVFSMPALWRFFMGRRVLERDPALQASSATDVLFPFSPGDGDGTTSLSNEVVLACPTPVPLRVDGVLVAVRPRDPGNPDHIEDDAAVLTLDELGLFTAVAVSFPELVFPSESGEYWRNNQRQLYGPASRLLPPARRPEVWSRDCWLLKSEPGQPPDFLNAFNSNDLSFSTAAHADEHAAAHPLLFPAAWRDLPRDQREPLYSGTAFRLERPLVVPRGCCPGVRFPTALPAPKMGRIWSRTWSEADEKHDALRRWQVLLDEKAGALAWIAGSPMPPVGFEGHVDVAALDLVVKS